MSEQKLLIKRILSNDIHRDQVQLTRYPELRTALKVRDIAKYLS
jgi:hypothetical protein